MACVPKKGLASLDNAKPIALLSTIYKLYATIHRDGLQPVLEPFLHDTQYGFRAWKKCGAANMLLATNTRVHRARKTQITLHLLGLDKGVRQNLSRENIPGT